MAGRKTLLGQKPHVSSLPVNTMEQDASIHTCSLMSNGVSGNDSGKHSVYRIDWFLDNITADRHAHNHVAESISNRQTTICFAINYAYHKSQGQKHFTYQGVHYL